MEMFIGVHDLDQKWQKGDGHIQTRTHILAAFQHHFTDLDQISCVWSLGEFKMTHGVKIAIFTFLGGPGAILGAPGGSC